MSVLCGFFITRIAIIICQHRPRRLRSERWSVEFVSRPVAVLSACIDRRTAFVVFPAPRHELLPSVARKIVWPASSTVCCQLCHSPFQRSPPLIASRHRRGNRSLSLSRVCRGGLGQGGHAELYALIGSAFVWRTSGGWEGGGQRIGEIMDRRGESLSRPVPLSYNATCFPINGTSGGAAPCRRR